MFRRRRPVILEGRRMCVEGGCSKALQLESLLCPPLSLTPSLSLLPASEPLRLPFCPAAHHPAATLPTT